MYINFVLHTHTHTHTHIYIHATKITRIRYDDPCKFSSNHNPDKPDCGTSERVESRGLIRFASISHVLHSILRNTNTGGIGDDPTRLIRELATSAELKRHPTFTFQRSDI